MSDICCFEAHKHGGLDGGGKRDRPNHGLISNGTRGCFAEEDHERQCGPEESGCVDDKPIPGGTKNEPSKHGDEDDSAETAPLMRAPLELDRCRRRHSSYTSRSGEDCCSDCCSDCCRDCCSDCCTVM